MKEFYSKRVETHKRIKRNRIIGNIPYNINNNNSINFNYSLQLNENKILMNHPVKKFSSPLISNFGNLTTNNNNIYSYNTQHLNNNYQFNNNLNTYSQNYTKILLKQEFYNNNNFKINNNFQDNFNKMNHNANLINNNINIINNNVPLKKTIRHIKSSDSYLLNKNNFFALNKNKNENWFKLNAFNSNFLNEKVFSRNQFDKKVREEIFKQWNTNI